MAKKEAYKLQAVDSIERLPLSEQVYITLKQAILRGDLQPTEKLNEVKIAEQLKVSATPVREAFRKLAKDNLVVIVPWKGVTVKGDTPEEIVALYQCREVMEGLGARLCAERATEEQIEELKTLKKLGFKVNEHYRLCKTVEEIELPEDAALAAIVRDGRVITAKAHDVFAAGDELLFVASSDAEARIKSCFITS